MYTAALSNTCEMCHAFSTTGTLFSILREVLIDTRKLVTRIIRPATNRVQTASNRMLLALSAAALASIHSCIVYTL